MSKQTRNDARIKKHLRVRTKISGTPEMPRLNVFKSLKHFEAQLIDDTTGRTLAHSSSISLKMPYGGNVVSAEKIGKDMGAKIKKLGIKHVVFDRGGYVYHGRVAAFADAVRKEGVEF